MNKIFSVSLVGFLLIFAFTPLINFNSDDIEHEVKAYQELPTVGSYDNLKQIIKDSEKLRNQMYGGIRGGVMVLESADGANMAEQAKSAAMDTSDNFSTTNVQVQGVDEADVIKTDGKYIYQVNHNKIVISEVFPADEMKIINTLTFDEQEFIPREIYVDEKYLTVIGSSQIMMPYQDEPTSNVKEMSRPYYYNNGTVKAVIYNIEDKSNINKIREFEVEGHYVSSRKIGSSLYLVANKFLDVYLILEEDREMPAPLYRDSINGNQTNKIDYENIHYFPDSVEPNYLMIAGIDLDKPNQEVNVETFLGAGENIYASTENLYVAVTYFNFEEEKKINGDMIPPERTTSLFKFKLENGSVVYTAQGEVPGSILNQFSMDEFNNYFRIATTTGEIWREDEFTSKNNLYVLNEDLETIGKIEDIAPGERIYSARFMGERAYMVTFKKVDPLFVIDLKEPTAPKILGKLKIPGYSDYLHPYDENHIIGFGKDAAVDGKNDKVAFYQGMKIAIFDVSDVNNPKEKFVEIIGDRGTDSELLHNHKALLFSKNRNLLAFPITVMEVKNKENSSVHDYGEFTFQGAYIYNIDLENGFTLRKTITHLSDGDYNKSGYGWYESNKNIERIIYIDDVLYTISKGMIKAHQIDGYSEINSITIKN